MTKLLEDLNLGTGTYSHIGFNLVDMKTGEKPFKILNEIINNILIENNERFFEAFKVMIDSFSDLTSLQNLTEAGQETKSIVDKKYKTYDLRIQYEQEIEENASYFSIAKKTLNNYFIQIEDLITLLNYEKISFEFTPDSSFFFNIIMNKKIKAHIEIYLEDLASFEKNAFFNIFEDRKSIKTGYGKIIDIVREINYFSE